MGCNCGKGKTTTVTASGERRQTVYRVVLANGTVHSEHDNNQLARLAANASGGRVTVTSKVVSNV